MFNGTGKLNTQATVFLRQREREFDGQLPLASPPLASDVAISLRRTPANVVTQIASLFPAQVYMIDPQNRLVACSEPGVTQIPLEIITHTATGEAVHVPFHLNDHQGTLVLYFASAYHSFTPQLVETVVQLILEKAFLLEQLPDQPQLKNKLISDLLRGQIINEADTLFRAKLLGLDLSPPRAVLLIDATQYLLSFSSTNGHQTSEIQIHYRTQAIINKVIDYFHLPSDTICAYLGEGMVAVLKASDTQNLVQWAEHHQDSPVEEGQWANLDALKRAARGLLAYLPGEKEGAIKIGIGRYHNGWRGLARSYEDARIALSLGCRLQQDAKVYCLDEFGIAAFVGIADERIKTDLALHMLSPLDDEAELLETVTAFFAANCQLTVTAHQLDIHRNTLSYRLDKIASLTGLDPRRFDEAIQIRLALLLRQLGAQNPTL